MIETSTLMGRLLFVDDEPRNLDILEELFEDFEFESAKSGDQALEKLEYFPADVVLLDIMMEGIDGYEVCRKIRQNPDLAGVRVMLVSGKAMVEERLLGFEAGADDYVTKPFSLDELFARVQVLLRNSTSYEVSQLREEFFCLFSHETRTPLNGILGLTEVILAEENIQQGELREYMRMIEGCGRRLLQLTNSALLLKELRYSTLDEQTSRTIPEAISYAICEVLELADMHGVKFTRNVSEHTSPKSYPLLGVAVKCILENAIIFGGRGCNIALRAYSVNDLNYLEVVSSKALAEDVLSFLEEELNTTGIYNHHSIKGLSFAATRIIAHRNGGSVSTYQLDGKTRIVLELPES